MNPVKSATGILTLFAGGIWYWNNYPGARVDTTTPSYQLMAKETWNTWEWKHLFPGRDELVEYFRHLSRVWNLDKDISFNSKVTGLRWDADTSRWTYEINNGESSGKVREVLGYMEKPCDHPGHGLIINLTGMGCCDMHRFRSEEIYVSPQNRKSTRIPCSDRQVASTDQCYKWLKSSLGGNRQFQR